MQRAKYFCSGSLDISKYHHYALNEDFYTHFTSPIRRYADVIVHRLLETAISNEDRSNRGKVVDSFCSKLYKKIDGFDFFYSIILSIQQKNDTKNSIRM